VNRIVEEYNGTSWITKNSYGGSISLLNYKIKKREKVNLEKNKKKKKSIEQNNFQDDVNEKIIKEQNYTTNNEISKEKSIQNSNNSESNSNQIDEITFQLYFLKPKYYINDSGKGVLKAGILSYNNICFNIILMNN